MKIKIALTILILMMVGDLSYGGARDGVLDVKGKAVVFFGPAQKEYDSLSKNDKNE